MDPVTLGMILSSVSAATQLVVDLTNAARKLERGESLSEEEIALARQFAKEAHERLQATK